jgi:Transcriptional regulator, AbiEi antitoxin, Type IV TA system/Transcriptional regulator, AbiEi antitoxin N-terminal domain
MFGPNKALSNQLAHQLPEGLLVDTPWLKRHGYSRQLVNYYVHAGLLDQLARGVYARQRGTLKWEQVVISLQAVLLDTPLVVGGRSALEQQGYAHYLPQATQTVHLYGPKPPPAWLQRLPAEPRFIFHNAKPLFSGSAALADDDDLRRDLTGRVARQDESPHPSLVLRSWGQWDWPLVLSSPERAILELLDELPAGESFHQVDVLFEGLTGLSPRRLGQLLVDCRSIKVKRLFFFFANRHSHAWLKRLDRRKVDLGTGKRLLVKGGKLDPATQITVPEDLHAVR